ncbi:cell division protein FtsL [Anaerosalibacter massiliensis]|uniref:cell division protein FtsL n=1 Tax=Anaerosalibacter massiliensis TaxID=1347392 RepID=UPI0005B28C68|nr:cell division protein FtsL [Anaerosalibacter massiliensis]
MLVAKREENHYYTERNKTRKPKKNNKNKKNKSNDKLKFLLCATIILLTCLLILLRYTYITKMRLEVSKLENEKNQLEKEKQEAVAELDRVKSASKIEEDAKVKLGMDYPTDEQVVYVSIDEQGIKDNEDNKEAKEKDEFFIVGYLKNMMDIILKKF